MKSVVSNLQEGTWFHLVQIRNDKGVAVVQIDPGSPVDQAGLQPGDLVISVNGVDLRSRPEAYFHTRLQSKPGDRLDLVWIRSGDFHNGILTLKDTEEVPYVIQIKQQQIVMGVEVMTWFQRGSFLIFPIVLLCFGTWMGFRRPRNNIAFQCALLFLATALSTSPAFHPMIAGWPTWMLSLSIVVVLTASFLKTMLILEILCVFPSSTTLGTWLRKRKWLVLTPIFAWTVFRLVYFLSLTYGWNNEMTRFVVGIVEPVPVSTLPIIVVSLAGGLLIAQQVVAQRQKRMRLQLIEIGFFLALVLAPLWTILQPGSLLASWDVFSLRGSAFLVLVWFLDRIVQVGLQCALPFSFAYAIMAHRVFGLRFVFGRSLRYLLAAQSLYLVLSLGMFIVFYETISSWSVGMNVSDLIVACLAAGCVLILIGGWTWMKTPTIRYMDRHLLREEYENRQRLFKLGRTLTQFQDRNSLLEKTGRELLEGLDLCFVAIYLYEQQNTLSVSWHGARNFPGQRHELDASFFIAQADKITRTLQFTSSEKPIIEHKDINGNESPVDLVFEIFIILRGESNRRGCIALGTKLSEEPFSRDEKEQLLVLATELELALENIEIGASLKQQTQRLQRLSRRLINVQETERHRLARDLHDDSGQALTALKISLELTHDELSGVTSGIRERLHDAIALTDETLGKLRSIAHDLRPPTLDTVGLSAALDGLCKSFAHRTRVLIEYEGLESTKFSQAISIGLYRILQEGLANCARHARAGHIKVELKHNGQNIRLSISDDGRGFEPHKTLEDQNEIGTGLIGMHERLESLGGRLDIYSQPEAGTRLVASIPWEDV